MNTYKLLTPGPLTTTTTVKEEMLTDRCTWDTDYKQMTQKIRRQLLDLAHAPAPDYTVVLMQGSGTFGVESVLSSAIGDEDKCLILVNGAYSERMVQIADYHKLDYVVHKESYQNTFSPTAIDALLNTDPTITHVAMVHCETTTGILNNIEDIAAVCAKHDKCFIVDAMSSFGAVDIDVPLLNIGYLISSANKCIQGVPGFSFIIAQSSELQKCRKQARSLSLDLYAQWVEMNKDGKWRFTSPTHVVAAFAKALEELFAEGGINARGNRYALNNRILREKMDILGFKAYIAETQQSPIITTFLFPDGLNFPSLYTYLKKYGYVIYPGKLTDIDTFRIGNIGEIYPDDIDKICALIASYMEGKKHA